ncbi:MAG: diguanylate cyclase [Asticcacaulis sp.]
MAKNAQNYMTDRYMQQLSKGFKYLSFSPELEQKYRVYMSSQQRRSASVCTIVGLVLWTAFAILDFQRINVFNEPLDTLAVVWLSLRGIVWLALLVTIYVLVYTRYTYRYFVLITYIALGIAASITADLASYKGEFSAQSAQIVVVMAAFLPLGLPFYKALIGAIIVSLTGVLVLATGYAQRDISEGFQLALMLIVAVPVSAVGGYLREYAHRDHFLIRGVLDHQAMTDGLTGVANRRRFTEAAQKTFNSAGARVFSLIAIDVDMFKSINDTYGHQVGDTVLKEIAARCYNVMRNTDLFARTGGEEFAVILPGTETPEAKLIAERLRAAVNSAPVDTEAGPLVVSISIGVTLSTAAETLSGVMKIADDCLYQAKVAGRNRVVVAPLAA